LLQIQMKYNQAQAAENAHDAPRYTAR